MKNRQHPYPAEKKWNKLCARKIWWQRTHTTKMAAHSLWGTLTKSERKKKQPSAIQEKIELTSFVCVFFLLSSFTVWRLLHWHFTHSLFIVWAFLSRAKRPIYLLIITVIILQWMRSIRFLCCSFHFASSLCCWPMWRCQTFFETQFMFYACHRSTMFTFFFFHRWGVSELSRWQKPINKKNVAKTFR